MSFGCLKNNLTVETLCSKCLDLLQFWSALGALPRTDLAFATPKGRWADFRPLLVEKMIVGVVHCDLASRITA